MVIPFVALSSRVQANIGIIRGGVARGLSSTAINDLIRSTGQTGIRRTDLLAGIRSERGVVESASRIRSVPLDRFPDPSRIAQAKGRMLSNFSYDVRVRGIDSITGEASDRFITVRSNTNLTPRQIQAEALEAVEEAPETARSGEISEIESMVIVGARRR